MHTPNTGGPAFGPKPALVLDEAEAQSLVESRVTLLASDMRKVRARERWAIYSEDFRDLIEARIDTTHLDQEVRSRIFSHIDLSSNLALDITNAICVVWKHNANRFVPDASDEQNEALRKLVEESHFHRHARSWNREAFLLGPVTVIPVLRGGKLSFDTLLPHFYDTLDDPDDLWGSPLAAVWDVATGCEDDILSRHTGTRAKATAIMLDAGHWRYYQVSGAGGARHFQEIDAVEHRIGEFPGSTLSFDIAHGAGRWSCERHQRLIDATITISAIDAAMEFVRKSQNKKMMTIVGNLEGVPTGQVIDPEKGFVARAPSPEQVQISIHDLDLDPENHIKHQAWKMQTITRSYGGQVASRPGSTSMLEAEVSFSHEALTEQRNEQIPFAKDFERELWSKAVKTCKQQGHPLAAKLPDPESVRTSLVVEFPPLTRSFVSIKDQLIWEADALSRGKIRHTDLVRNQLPGASEAELQKYIEDNLDAQGPLIEKMTKRDQSLNPSEAPANKTKSQLNGEEGPRARDSEE